MHGTAGFRPGGAAAGAEESCGLSGTRGSDGLFGPQPPLEGGSRGGMALVGVLYPKILRKRLPHR